MAISTRLTRLCVSLYISGTRASSSLYHWAPQGVLLNAGPIQDPQSAPQTENLTLDILIRQYPKRRQVS